MGDKSPKAVSKQANIKKTKVTAEKAKKTEAAAAKKVTKK